MTYSAAINQTLKPKVLFIKILWLTLIGFVTSLPIFFSQISSGIYQFSTLYFLSISILSVYLFFFFSLIISSKSCKTGAAFFATGIFVFAFFILTEAFVIHFYGARIDEAAFVHLSLESVSIAINDFPLLSFSFVFSFCICALLSSKFATKLIIRPHVFSKTFMLIILLLLVLLANAFIQKEYITQHPFFYTINAINNFYFKKSGVMPSKQTLKYYNLKVPNPESYKSIEFTKPQSNIIIVYLESINFAFTDLGHSQEKLTPNLDKLALESLVFTNYYSTETYTIAGIIASQCGMTPPMKSGNSSLYERGDYFSNVVCLSDILFKAGYYQEYFGGANKHFAGKSSFLKTHAFNKINGIFDYKVNRKEHPTWGLYDKALFKFAFDRIDTLQAEKKLFNVTLLTLNTHIPGVNSNDCKKIFKDPMLNAAHCTDKGLGDFIDNLKFNGFLENTTLIVTSDHILFRTMAMKQSFGDNAINDHRINFLIRPSGKTKNQIINNTLSGSYDFAPTILGQLGIKHPYHFTIGQDILKKDPDNKYLHDRHELYKKDNCTRKSNLDAIQDNSSACLTRAVINTQDIIIDQSNKNIFHTNSLIPVTDICDFFSEMEIIYSNDHYPRKILVNDKNIIDQISVSGWKFKKSTFNGFYYIFYNINTQELQLGAVVYDDAFRRIEQITQSPTNSLLVLVSSGDWSKISKKKIALLKKLGAKKIFKQSTNKAFVLFSNPHKPEGAREKIPFLKRVNSFGIGLCKKLL